MQVRCPFPKCTHVGEIITKVHCRMHHNMEREVVFKKYGEPERVFMNPYSRSKKNTERQGISLRK